jgi:hypothetical protein
VVHAGGAVSAQSLALVGVGAAFAACGPIGPGPDPGAEQPPPPPLVAVERGAGGVRLVFVGEDGERKADLTAPPAADGIGYVVDAQPRWSPDGRFVAFVSTRGGGREPGIWLVQALADGAPRVLWPAQPGISVRDPAWAPDGNALLFASNRAGTFDIWRIAVERDAGGWPRVVGAPEAVVDTSADEIGPSFGPDGRMAYTVIDHRDRSSTIWVADRQGKRAQQLTRGGLEQTPAWSPDGRWIAYAAPAPGRTDLDIFAVRPDGTRARRLLDEPLAHQSEPTWSPDGRFLFAVATLRARGGGQPGTRAPVRVLLDPAHAPRLGIAVGSSGLDGAQLRKQPVYAAAAILDALRTQCHNLGDDQRPPVCEGILAPNR